MPHDLDRCAAWIAARDALVSVHDESTAWPPPLAADARRAAIAAVALAAEGLAHRHGSAARRRCVRDALQHALALAATLEVVHATGPVTDDAAGVARAQHHASKSVALLGLLLHANFVAVGR